MLVVELTASAARKSKPPPFLLPLRSLDAAEAEAHAQLAFLLPLRGLNDAEAEAHVQLAFLIPLRSLNVAEAEVCVRLASLPLRSLNVAAHVHLAFLLPLHSLDAAEAEAHVQPGGDRHSAAADPHRHQQWQRGSPRTWTSQCMCGCSALPLTAWESVSGLCWPWLL